MSHAEQRQFCEWVRDRYADQFATAKCVLDCGSLDINGNNRYLFTNPNVDYCGIDIHFGANVTWQGRVHDYWSPYAKGYDIVISTEMLEHDEFYQASLRRMAGPLLKDGGILVFTCATTGRPEHGTAEASPADSPSTNNYYRNLEAKDIAAIPGFLEQFETYAFYVEDTHKDLCFYGLKKLPS